MKFYRSGSLKEDALDKMVDINPSEKLPDFVLKRLDYLIEFIGTKNADSLDAFVSSLESRYKKTVNADYTQSKSIDVNSTLSNYNNLQKYTSLATSAINYYIQILGIADGNAWDESVDVFNRDFHRAFLLPRYHNLVTMIETMGREDAIKIWKQFFTYYIIDNRKPSDTPFVDLETLLEERNQAADDDSDWVMVRGMIAEGKYAYRNDNCLWVDALDDLTDSEIKYYICCYGDYEGARRYYHDSIILTMEHTIAQGDPYCSRVLHDTRVDYDLRHPTKEFWDNMYPEDA